MNTKLMMWCEVCYSPMQWVDDEYEILLVAESIFCPCCKQENKVTDEMVETLADWMGIEITVIEEYRNQDE